jgi:hypothetical protein
MKMHNLKTAKANYETVSFFYIREKNDVYGNPRFRVYILDSETATVYETIFKCYESQIPERVTTHIENQIGVNIPF